MVKKKELTTTIAIVILLSTMNIFLFLNKGDASYTNMSGKFMENIPELPAGINLSIVAFIVQWVILLAVLFFAYTKFLKHRHHEEIKLNLSHIKKNKTRAGTDLDTLYNLIQEKKILNTDSISKVFGIKKEKAIEWAKILENHELVDIEYPTFSTPEVKLHEKEDEKEEKEAGNKEKPKKGVERKEKNPTKDKEKKKV